MTLREIVANLELVNEIEREKAATQLSLSALAARGEPKQLKEQIDDLIGTAAQNASRRP